MRPDCQAAAAPFALAVPRLRSGRLGDHLGVGQGNSLEFVEHRDYAPGDDLRQMDWRAFARTDRPMIRLHRAELSPAVELLVDTSASMTATEHKEQSLRDLVAAFGLWSRTGGFAFRCLELGGGPVVEPDQLDLGGADPERWEPREPFRMGSLRYLISDFLSPLDRTPFVRTAARGAAHVTVLHLLDAWERDPEPLGLASLTDCESNERLDIQFDEAGVARYRARLARLVEGVARATAAASGTFVPLTAAEPAALFAQQLAPAGVLTVGQPG